MNFYYEKSPAGTGPLLCHIALPNCTIIKSTIHSYGFNPEAFMVRNFITNSCVKLNRFMYGLEV